MQPCLSFMSFKGEEVAKLPPFGFLMKHRIPPVEAVSTHILVTWYTQTALFANPSS